MLNKIINIICISLLLVTLSACKQEISDEEELVGVNEQYTSEDSTYTYKSSDLETDKVESVFVKADPYGNAEKTEVEVTLKAKEDEELKDVNKLDNIINTSGDENYKIKDDQIVFENHGSDITYKGTTNKELPVSVNITYYLDNQEISPSELAHKSGHVKMVFNYENNSSLNNNVQVPFICLTMLMLDEDKFSNVALENGKLINLSGNKIVTLYGEPGLKESLKLYTIDTFDDIKLTDSAILEADVDDFTLDYTSTIISNGVFKELETKDINELSNSINDLSKLNDKIDEIKEATSKLKDEGDKLVDGVGELKTNADKLNDAASTFNTSISQIGTLTSGLATLASQISSVVTNDNLANVKSAIETTDTLLNVMLCYCNTLISIKGEVDNINLEDLKDLDNENPTKIAITNIKNSDFSNITLDSLNELKNNIETLKTSLNSKEFIKGYDTLVSTSASLEIACKTIDSDETKNQVINGASALYQASSSFKDVITSLNDNMPDLKNAINEFSDKINEAVDDNRSDLNKFSGSNIKNIITNIKNLKKVDVDYDTFLGKIDGTSSSVTFTIETSEIK